MLSKKVQTNTQKITTQLSKVRIMLKNNHSLEHNARFSVILDEATGGVLEKKVFLKITILKVAIKILTSSNAFFKNFNCKLEPLFLKRGFSGLLLLSVYSFFIFRAEEFSWKIPRFRNFMAPR